jgi:hypothetical protein
LNGNISISLLMENHIKSAAPEASQFFPVNFLPPSFLELRLIRFDYRLFFLVNIQFPKYNFKKKNLVLINVSGFGDTYCGVERIKLFFKPVYCITIIMQKTIMKFKSFGIHFKLDILSRIYRFRQLWIYSNRIVSTKLWVLLQYKGR